jgi:predicted dehydrogenase
MRRFVLVGTGGRGTYSFVKPLREEFAGSITLAGLYDRNPARAAACNRLVGAEIPVFTDFTAMLDQVRPDGVVVTTMDCTHAQYVVQALERHIPAFSEKPLCTTVEQVRAIRRAAAASRAKGWVTHNMRFGPDIEVVKEHLLKGTIGRVLSINFTETLDRFHGADYFRRWHRQMANSAGLMVHKSSHHFDALNWLADALPVNVTAQGRLAYYGRNGEYRGERCSTCAHAPRCPHYADIFKDPRMTTMYRDVEAVDGYRRDGCVFDPAIDIPDTVSASISYANGVVAGYNLIAYASYESMRIAIEGTLGRIEFYHRYGTGWAVGHESEPKGESIANDGKDAEDFGEVKLYLPRQRQVRNITAPLREGGHGGSDPKLRQFLFGDRELPDPLGQKAPLEAGIQAVLVGLAANASMAQGGAPIAVQSLA